MKNSIAIIFALIASLGATGDLYSQDEAVADKSGKVELKSWVKEFRQKDNAAILHGNVEVSRDNIKILADSVVIWFDGKGSEVSDIYAEGNILLTDGRDRISAQALYYDFNTDDAFIADAWVQTTQRALDDLAAFQRQKESGAPAKEPYPEIGLYFRARKLRTERPTRYVGERLTLSTCENIEPHWGIISREATVYPGGTVEARGNSIFLGFVKIPFFNVRFEPDWRMPLYRLRIGRSSDKGNFTLTRWQLLIEQNYKFYFDLDFFNKRGTGRGALLEYKNRALPWLGYIEGYLINDREPPTGEDSYRYRAKWLHLMNLPGGVRANFEFSKISDATFLKEFFEREYKKGREQETYAYFTKTYRNLGARFFASMRTEEFLTDTLYQPQLRTDVISKELPGGFYFDAATRNEKVKVEYAEALALPDIEVERHDALIGMNRPIRGGRFFNVKPGLQARYTHYNINNIDSQNIDRETVTASVTADTRISRNYGTKSKPLKIDGLKHSIEPQVRYSNTYENDADPSELYQLDEVDAVDKEEVFTFSLTNRLSTRRKERDKSEIANLLDFRLEIPYYPKARRDNAGENYGPLESRLEVCAIPFLTIRSDLQYDTAARHMLKGSGNVSVSSPGLWSAYLGAIYAAGDGTIGTAGLSARLSAKWSASARVQHNLSAGRYVSKTFTLTRKFHCWIMEMGVVVEREKDSPTYTFLVSPAAIFKKEKLRINEESTFLK